MDLRAFFDSRYCFNRAAHRKPNELNKRLFGLAECLVLGTPLLLLLWWMFSPKLIS